MFDTEKKTFLTQKPDKSRKNAIDKPIEKLIQILNEKKNYYTTSSCSGRIMLIKKADASKKYEAEWLFVSHNQVLKQEYQTILQTAKSSKGTVWFKQESLILHVCCRTIDFAQQLVDIARLVGFKKSGIMNARKRILVEIVGPDMLETIVMREGTLLVSEEYIFVLIEEANKKMERNQKKIKEFQEAIEKIEV